ncbi:hypothetical protein SY2F82_37910 [Streptomyces sp. Y2F8-2]|nr:hypothetical protein SY2F82_37910 [Streptomyces sp. Y2F8-2]
MRATQFPYPFDGIGPWLQGHPRLGQLGLPLNGGAMGDIVTPGSAADNRFDRHRPERDRWLACGRQETLTSLM